MNQPGKLGFMFLMIKTMTLLSPLFKMEVHALSQSNKEHNDIHAPSRVATPILPFRLLFMASKERNVSWKSQHSGSPCKCLPF